MKFLIESYGCQLNMAESAAIETMLIGRGLEKTENPDEADAVILNTCSVRKTAENRIWGRLGFYSSEKKKHKLILIVTGCMAERMQEELKKEAPYIDAVIGSNEKAEIPDFIIGEPLEQLDGYRFLSSYYREGDYSSYVPIMNGCNNFCSYCIVPYVRGREVSRPVEEILKEICFLEQQGVKEITLLGQNVNSYSAEYDGEHVDFPRLLELILPYLRNIMFVRFESPHPKDFSDHLISVIADNDRISKHIHLPVQSGSTRILQLMNRKTTREKTLDLIRKMKERIPHLTLSTDVMTGFPTETDEEYEETLSLMEEMGCTEAFMYYFNPREGTRAASMDGQIDESVKIKRLERLIDEQIKRQAVIKEAMLPFTALAIVTGKSRDDEDRYLARGEHNDYFSFSSSVSHNPGDAVIIDAEELKGNTFRGKERV